MEAGRAVRVRKGWRAVRFGVGRVCWSVWRGIKVPDTVLDYVPGGRLVSEHVRKLGQQARKWAGERRVLQVLPLGGVWSAGKTRGGGKYVEKQRNAARRGGGSGYSGERIGSLDDRRGSHVNGGRQGGDSDPRLAAGESGESTEGHAVLAVWNCTCL